MSSSHVFTSWCGDDGVGTGMHSVHSMMFVALKNVRSCLVICMSVHVCISAKSFLLFLFLCSDPHALPSLSV
ncbi:uncharacterized protein BP01DRAFT_81863 [Aspergillus saccharolyticus JOP 1030-1]|uniref:Uncharacterized protein n=1 Tax=Aspergillus saccharolyticus JOP 1030-1 TaxID=1450539 RepID=A0A318ZDL0_9EURO|nr:hypothetical protein BP01DRAFT_81863 [Aspergillus saccharolyticus JOP 1030-1]PYH44384.1 hypothetical protein BP01DRAFT_81863 [Aspergillus saccharolyticus JOP 1030-1]